MVSWYTYPPDDNEIGVVGRENPVLCASTTSREGKLLSGMFDQAFLWLSTRGDTTDFPSQRTTTDSPPKRRRGGGSGREERSDSGR